MTLPSGTLPNTANVPAALSMVTTCSDVRRTLLFCLAYPVQCMALDLTDPRAAALVREMAQRASSAIIEMGALELVPR